MLPEKLLAQMQEATVETPGSALGDAIGISWMLRDVEGVRMVGHGGDTVGQHSTFDMVPERQFAIVGLTNCGPNGNQFLDELGRWALEAYLGIVERDPEPLALGAERAGRLRRHLRDDRRDRRDHPRWRQRRAGPHGRDQAGDAGQAGRGGEEPPDDTRRSRSASCPDRATATSSPTVRPRG